MPVRPPPDAILVQLLPALHVFVRKLSVMRWPVDVQLSSWWRSLAENGAAGGAPRSQHLVGTAIDVVTRDRALVVAEARAVGLVAIDEGDHVHVQLWPAATSPVTRYRLV